jgi:hypothetical protein
MKTPACPSLIAQAPLEKVLSLMNSTWTFTWELAILAQGKLKAKDQFF